MLGELVNIPTDRLVDMLLVVLGGCDVLNASDVVEIETILRELQRRADDPREIYRNVN